MTSLTLSLIKTKAKAGITHFTISLLIFCFVVAWVYFFAYPDVYFTMAGAIQGLTLVFLIDVVLGPLLSFLVYNPAKPKKEIISDLVIIGAVQIAALVYGLTTLYKEQPQAVIIYPKSSATVINKREMTDFELGELSQYEKLGKLPAAVYTPDRKHPYQSMLQSLDVIKETDLANRRTLAQNMDDLAVLQSLEKQYGKLYILSVMAKYNGAYFALDEDFNLVAKFGEKPIS
ncbi:hypothetical protein LP090_02895 [Moraxella bovis]|uniref:Pilus assembly protein n=1 Tax=Moraxella bovis TaxID=476 RepID=A0ABY6M9Q4_MORBO|nr:hypothetical protein [Moraxella bovis]UYZ73676.1 hypothetical protein LP105_02860 [Moraxella bovis]UZA03765.1 hypothetical protein LP092_03140 [Moraxella bovis]UZA27941.1 hypothetical protein LP119_02890 [Moraxella bovis]UZA43566.1 hypothetical protein LP090_02895 [Moraxella bovis]WAJ74137.1 hypothetical protein LP095_02900 [Moraxella bovis]